MNIVDPDQIVASDQGLDCLLLTHAAVFNPCPAEPGYTLPLQTVKIQIRSGSALFVIQNVNLYQQFGLSNLTWWTIRNVHGILI